MTWMIYGANGYTGELIARLAVEAGEKPILAGRTTAPVAELAQGFGLDHRVFPVHQADVRDVEAVLHCAGPFSRTSAPMVEACLRDGVHYLDLTGEVSVLEAVYARHDEAIAAGVALVPGVGFDVVPTDHLLARLHAELPDATDADAVLISRGGFSAGTLRTAVEGMREGCLVRADGEVRTVATGHRRRTVTVDGHRVKVLSVPLGDVSSGYRATGIPTITDFTTVPLPGLVARLDPFTRRALAPEWIYTAVDRTIARRVGGPSTKRRSSTQSDLWAELSNAAGEQVRAAIRVPNTYDFTARSALHAVRRTLAGVEPGAWAPSQAFGADFIATIPDITVSELATD